MNKKAKKVLSLLLSFTMIVSVMQINLANVLAAKNTEDTGISLDFDSLSVGTKPTAVSSGGVKDGAGASTGVVHYSAQGGRGDGYSYISSPTASNTDTNKYFVYDTITTLNYSGWYNNYTYIRYADAASAIGKVFVYEADVQYVQGNLNFCLMDSNTGTQGRSASTLASMSFNNGIVTCGGASTDMTDKTFAGITRDSWYKLTIVYSVPDATNGFAGYVSYDMKKINSDNTVTDLGVKIGTPSSTKTQVGYAGVTTVTPGSATAPAEAIAYIDNWNVYEVKPSASIITKVTGDSSLTKEALGISTMQFTASGIHNSTDETAIPLVGTLKPTWSLKTPVQGFSIDENGLLTADSTTTSGTYDVTVVATLGGVSVESVVSANIVSSTSKYYDVVVKYLDSQDLTKEIKTSRIIPAQKQDTLVSASDTDIQDFDAFIGSDEYHFAYNAALSKTSVVADEYDFIIQLAFDKTLKTDVTIKYVDKSTNEPIATDRVQTGLLAGTTYSATTSDLAPKTIGKTVYTVDSSSTTSLQVTKGATITLYFNALDDDYYSYENFDGLSIGDKWGTSSQRAGDGKVIAESDRGNVMTFDGGANSGDRGVTKPLAISATNYYIEFDLYAPTLSGSFNRFEFADGASGTSQLAYGATRNVLMRLGADSGTGINIYTFAEDGTTEVATPTGATTNTWYTVKAKVNTVSKQFDYVTLTKVGETTPTYQATAVPFVNTSATGLKNINIYGNRSSGLTNIGYKIDEFKIFNKAGEYVVTDFVNGSLSTWTVTGSQAITYASENNVNYMNVATTTATTLKTPDFATKGVAIFENDILLADKTATVSYDFVNGTNNVASVVVPTTNLEANKWYTITMKMDFNNKTLKGIITNDQGAIVEQLSTSLSDYTSITNVLINQNAPSTISYANFKVIDGIPKAVTLTSEDLLTVDQISGGSMEINADSIYKVTTKNLLVDYTWNISAINDEGLSIQSDGGKKATLVATKDAKAQIITVTANADGTEVSKKIRIATSANSVLFDSTASPKNALIPFEGTKQYQYIANVVDGNTNPITGKTIAWDICDANLNPINLDGIAIDSNGLLSISPNAVANKIYVRASESSESLFAIVPVNVHGYNYDFGFDGVGDVSEGYMAVTPNTIYSKDTGAGLLAKDTAISNGSSTEDVLNGDYLQSVTEDSAITHSGYAPTNARFTFLVDLPNGDYQVTAKFKGSVFSQADHDTMVNQLIGSHKGSNTTMAEKTFTVPVVNGQLDLNFDCAANGYAQIGTSPYISPSVSSLQISKNPTRVKGDKPTLYIIGDSTSSNGTQGWGNVASDHTYGLINISNNGTAGRSFLSYYREARVDSVLANIKPGDIVTVGHGINYSGDTTATNTALFNLIADGAIQRGATPIFLTPTPGGYNSDTSKSFYNETTKTLKLRNNGTGVTGKQIAQERGILFIDVDKLGNDYFNSIPEATRTETVKSSYTDHNHFSVEGAHFIAKLILDQVFQSSLFNYTPEELVTVNCSYSGTTATINISNQTKKILTPNIYIGEYNEKGEMVSVTKADFNSTGGVALSIMPGMKTENISNTNTAMKIKDNIITYTMNNTANSIKTFIWDGTTLAPMSNPFNK